MTSSYLNPSSRITPEERLLTPLGDRDTPSPSAACLRQLEVILGVAVRGNLIEERDAARCLKILRLNPCERIARIGQRLILLDSVLQELHNIDARLDFSVDVTKKEMELVEQASKEWWARPTPEAQETDEKE